MGEEVNQIFEQLSQETDIFRKAKQILILKKEKDIPVTQISKRLQMKPSYVSHILRLNKLPPLIIDGYYSKTITPTHLYIISRLHTDDQMIAVYEKVLAHNLSVYDTEIIVRNLLYGVKPEGEYLSQEELKKFKQYMQRFGIDTKIIQSRIRSKIIFEIRGSLLDSSQRIRKIISLMQKQTDTVGE